MTIKRKGAYEYNRDWHQNASALVVPKVAEQVLLYDAPIRETLENWRDPFDFMLRVKVPRNSRLVIVYDDHEHPLQNLTRYYVTETGGSLVKIMPPLAGKTDERRFFIEKGLLVTVANNMLDAWVPPNLYYYEREIEKLVGKF